MGVNSLSLSMPTSINASKGSVLCVDDEPNILRALSWLLMKEFDVVTAQSAHEGLELIRTNDFDVVISDQRMPEMSGVDFLNQVRLLAPRAMRILLTGYSDMQAVLRSVNESEIFRFVSKPWDVTELPGIVAQAAGIARKQHMPPTEAPIVAAASPTSPTKLLVLDDDDAIHSEIEMSAGDLAQVVHATNPIDAFRILNNENIGIILTERALGGMDLTHLLCLIKRQQPTIVSIVLSDVLDSSLVTKMINQGQIFRFLPKPVKAGYLRLTVKAALTRHAELLEDPLLSERYQGEALSEEDLAAAQRLTESEAASTAEAPTPNAAVDQPPTGIFGKLGKLARNLIGS